MAMKAQTPTSYVGTQGHFLPMLSRPPAPHLLLVMSVLLRSTYSRTCPPSQTFCSCRDILLGFGIPGPASTGQRESRVPFTVQPEAWPLLPGLSGSPLPNGTMSSLPLGLLIAAHSYPGSSGHQRAGLGLCPGMPFLFQFTTVF